jgi:CheY-like chemotaxis protein
MRALAAVRKGDFSVRLPEDWVAIEGKVAEAFNGAVELNQRLTRELHRLARMAGREGKLGERATLGGAGGDWAAAIDAVNALIADMAHPLSETTRVIGAVAKGDLAHTAEEQVEGRPLRGEFLRLARTVNMLVDHLGSVASEVTRVVREVGVEGKLGGHATVKGPAGTWKDLTDSVNVMATNLTSQVRDVATVTRAVAEGDLTRQVAADAKGELLDLKHTINTMVEQLGSFAVELAHLAHDVGAEGRLGGQADVRGAAGTWKDLTERVNLMAKNLTDQVRNIAAVTTSVAKGDLTRKITVDAKGELLDLKNTINTMVDQLSIFADEVTRVAEEVGTEGRLGGQAIVKGVNGIWKELTDNVNLMARHLTDQVRAIAQVVKAMAAGDLKQKVHLRARGEVSSLADGINSMIDTLATFAEQVISVARAVGTDGKLGGQANVPGAAGTWKELTDAVNQLAARLTTQVRAISEVTTAVTQGDLTRSIQVEAQGEVEDLKNKINDMIRNLRETTQKNAEQDWLKTNLAKFSRMLQGQRDLLTVGKMVLSELAPVVSAQHGAFYTMVQGGPPRLRLLATYAYRERKNVSNEFALGEGLVGQAALEKEPILLTEVPADYVRIGSGLGEAAPLNVVVLPITFEGEVKAVMELASFGRFSAIHISFLEQLTESLGIVLNTIEANTRTEDLLRQSQDLARELQVQQEELQQTNEELEEKARLLAEQNAEVERKNREVEQARQALEEKAAQLALTSKYKSEFLANMSHELRTPLNSLLILAEQLGDNPEGNLTPRQVEFARTIHTSGKDLLHLINDILDLSKVESGTVTVDLGEAPFSDLQSALDRAFRPLAEEKGLEFRIELDPALPRAMHTDGKRLQQVLKNLLSNAIKFTERGSVTLRIGFARDDFPREHPVLRRASQVVAFSVVDTGIGIAPDKQQMVFEAFQQAEGGTARKYGGTGLGLAISRELARLLGGDLKVESAPSEGSTFTLYVPLHYPATARPSRQGPSPSQARERARRDVQGSEAALPERPAAELPPAEVEEPDTMVEMWEAEFEDDRRNLQPGDFTCVIVEDDLPFARFLYELARDKGFKAVVATRGAQGLALIREIQPSAVTLDISLPDIDGWRLLERIKDDPSLRHIPAYVISVTDDPERTLQQGALGYVLKPADRGTLAEAFDHLRSFLERRVKTLLVVEEDPVQCQTIVDMIGNGDVQVTCATTAGEALAALDKERYDCMVIDLVLPDRPGLEVLQEIKKNERLRTMPIVVYTAKQLSRKEETQLKHLAQTIILKDVRSPERLLDETALFLHRRASDLPEAKRDIVEKLHRSEDILAGKKVLLVDDDIRNIFAMTSTLERRGMLVVAADNGREALEVARKERPDVVLMDIMLPEMDGYETTRAMRQVPELESVPIIAVTAKAMRGDREKCLEAGASDYIAKPVDTERLLTLLRVWLYR